MGVCLCQTAARHIARAGLEPVIFLPHHPQCYITGRHHHTQFTQPFYIYTAQPQMDLLKIAKCPYHQSHKNGGLSKEMAEMLDMRPQSPGIGVS